LVNLREVLNGIFYVLCTECPWEALPKDLRPKSTVHGISIWGIETARWRASTIALRRGA
jgi:transposase